MPGLKVKRRATDLYQKLSQNPNAVSGRLRVIAAITQTEIIHKILDYVHQQQAPPRKPPARITRSTTPEIQFDAH